MPLDTLHVVHANCFVRIIEMPAAMPSSTCKLLLSGCTDWSTENNAWNSDDCVPFHILSSLNNDRGNEASLNLK